MAASHAWMVRAGEAGYLADEFRSKSFVGMGDPEFGDLSGGLGKPDIRARITMARPDLKAGTIDSWMHQLHRLIHEVAVGDAVITYDPESRVYLIGEVAEAYRFRTDLSPVLPHARSVRWSQQAPRDALGADARHSLGSTLSIFKVTPVVFAEVRDRAAPLTSSAASATAPVTQPARKDQEALQLAAVRDETLENAKLFLEDRIAALGPFEVQHLVAGILRAMGYRTRVSEPGSDLGCDVFASPDGLGLEEPRIFVEVKHRASTRIGAPDIRAFLGGRKPGDRCIFVSTGGFAKEARYEAARATIAATLVDLPQLRELLVQHYESLDRDARLLVPLVRFYWPAN